MLVASRLGPPKSDAGRRTLAIPAWQIETVVSASCQARLAGVGQACLPCGERQEDATKVLASHEQRPGLSAQIADCGSERATPVVATLSEPDIEGRSDAGQRCDDASRNSG